MGAFDFFLKRNNEGKRNDVEELPSTKNFFIGAAEAEAEVSNTPFKLDQVYLDCFNIVEEINNEKFIIIGRKGCGKSAFGEYIYHIAHNDANMFCEFIKKSDVNLEHIVQISSDNSIEIQIELLYKWVILTKILDLILKNEAINSDEGLSNLKKFRDRNRGFVDINNFEVVELIRDKKFEIQLEYFKRFFNSKFGRDIKIKEEKAPFYKLLPYLEESIKYLLCKDKENSYILIFDDLDIGFKSTNSRDIKSLSELIRISKFFNNDFFARNDLSSKILILLRNDLSKYLNKEADMAKTLSSYSVEIDWYDETNRYVEDNVLLKKFINKRIEQNFISKNYPIYKDKPWESLIESTDFSLGNKSSFKYVIDHTFFRPRDLILFFRPLNALDLRIPLQKSDVNMLLGKYSTEMIPEIKNELSSVFSDSEIMEIFTVLEIVNKKGTNVMYDELYNLLFNSNLRGKEDFIIEELFYYSIIGNVDTSTGNIYFKFRENRGDICRVNKDQNIILHKIVKIHFN